MSSGLARSVAVVPGQLGHTGRIQARDPRAAEALPAHEVVRIVQLHLEDHLARRVSAQLADARPGDHGHAADRILTAVIGIFFGIIFVFVAFDPQPGEALIENWGATLYMFTVLASLPVEYWPAPRRRTAAAWWTRRPTCAT